MTYLGFVLQLCRVFSSSRKKSEIEFSTGVQFGFCPDATAVLLNDALHGRQAHAGARKVLGAMEPLKDPEEFISVFHIETYAVVCNADYGLTVFNAVAHPNNCALPKAGELDGVGE